MEKMNHIPAAGKLAKCPVCGGFFRDYGEYFACSTCYFSCGTAYLSRVSAAMELAEAKAWRQEVLDLSLEIEVEFEVMYESKEDVKKCEERVLEAFQK